MTSEGIAEFEVEERSCSNLPDCEAARKDVRQSFCERIRYGGSKEKIFMKPAYVLSGELNKYYIRLYFKV